MHSMTIKNQKYELTSYQNSLFYEIFPFAYCVELRSANEMVIRPVTLKYMEKNS